MISLSSKLVANSWLAIVSGWIPFFFCNTYLFRYTGSLSFLIYRFFSFMGLTWVSLLKVFSFLDLFISDKV